MITCLLFSATFAKHIYTNVTSVVTTDGDNFYVLTNAREYYSGSYRDVAIKFKKSDFTESAYNQNFIGMMNQYNNGLKANFNVNSDSKFVLWNNWVCYDNVHGYNTQDINK